MRDRHCENFLIFTQFYLKDFSGILNKVLIIHIEIFFALQNYDFVF